MSSELVNARGRPRFVVVTRQLIDAAGTSGCGFTNKQIAILDGPGRPQQGWRQRAIGKRLSYERGYDLLFQARRPKHRPKPGSQEEARALAIIDACAETPRREAALRQPEEIKRETRDDIRAIARSMQEPLSDTPPWIDGDDTACPLCHGDDLGRLSCQLCAGIPLDRVDDPWQALEEIATDAGRKPSAATARESIARAARLLRQVTAANGEAPREIAVTTQLVRALELCAQHEEANAP